jgi:hypothetical protein
LHEGVAVFKEGARAQAPREGHAIRQDISKIKERRENLGDVLRVRMESLITAFDGALRQNVWFGYCGAI